MANTPASRRYLEQYLLSQRAQKTKGLVAEGRTLLATPAFDIYRDPLQQAEQLDLLWADFFATGNPADVVRIASTLFSEREVATAARWSLTSNGTRSPTVRRLLQAAAKESESPAVRTQLERICKEIENAVPTH
jgi:hypothetical protein